MSPVIGNCPVHEFGERETCSISGVDQSVGSVFGTSFPETLNSCGHDRGRDRCEHRGRRTRHCARKRGHPRERRRNDLDGEIAVSFSLGIGYLEVVWFGGLLTIGNGRPVLSGWLHVHSPTLLPDTESERRFVGIAAGGAGRPPARVLPGSRAVACLTLAEVRQPWAWATAPRD